MPYGPWKNKDRFVDAHGRHGTVADADAGCVRVVYDSGKRVLLSPEAVSELRPAPAKPSTIACEMCGTQTSRLGTKRCDPCWEAERQIERIVRVPKLAIQMLEALANGMPGPALQILETARNKLASI